MLNVEQARSQLTRYEQYLAKDPQNPNLLKEVSELRLRLGDFPGAREAIEQALTSSPDDATLRSIKATVEIASGHAEGAIQTLNGLIADGYEAPALRYNLGYALLLARRLEEARNVLISIVDQPDTVPETPLLLARVLHHLGEMEGARNYAQRYTQVNPGNAEGLGVSALLALDDGEFEAAKQLGEKALAANPNNIEGLVTLGTVALEDHNAIAAAQHFDHAVDRHPKSGRAWSGKGLVDMLNLDLPKAIEDLKNAVKYMPNHIGTWHALAWCQIVTGDLAGARASLVASMDVDRAFGETHGGLAVIALLEGKRQEAERESKIALRLDPGSFAGRFAQSLLAAQGGDNAQAQAAIKEIFNTRFEEGGPTIQEQMLKIFREQRERGVVPRTKQ